MWDLLHCMLQPQLPLQADSTLPLCMKVSVSNISTPPFSPDFLWDVDPPCCACNFMGILFAWNAEQDVFCLELCFVSFSFIMRGSALLTAHDAQDMDCSWHLLPSTCHIHLPILHPTACLLSDWSIMKIKIHIQPSPAN